VASRLRARAKAVPPDENSRLRKKYPPAAATSTTTMASAIGRRTFGRPELTEGLPKFQAPSTFDPGIAGTGGVVAGFPTA